MISFLLTALGLVPILFHCFHSSFFFLPRTPWFQTKRHYLSSDEVMTEMSVAVTLTWPGVKISKWKPRNCTPRAVMFQHESRLPLMRSVFWNEQSGSFDVQFSHMFTLNGCKSISSRNTDTLVLFLRVPLPCISMWLKSQQIVRSPMMDYKKGIVVCHLFLGVMRTAFWIILNKFSFLMTIKCSQDGNIYICFCSEP